MIAKLLLSATISIQVKGYGYDNRHGTKSFRILCFTDRESASHDIAAKTQALTVCRSLLTPELMYFVDRGLGTGQVGGS